MTGSMRLFMVLRQLFIFSTPFALFSEAMSWLSPTFYNKYSKNNEKTCGSVVEKIW